MRCYAVYRRNVCRSGVAWLSVRGLRLQLGQSIDCCGGIAAQTAADVQVGEGHEKEGREGGSEEGAVDGLEPRVGWGVDIETGGAEELDSLVAGTVVQAYR